MNQPVTAKVNQKGHLEVGGCDVVELAKEFGTPLYVMDEATLRDRCQDYVRSFKAEWGNSEIVYASKALCTVGISRIIASEGLGFDVASGGELYTVLTAGADPKKIYFHGNNKSLAEIAEGLKAGIGRFVVDNMEELNNLDLVTRQAGRRSDILFRINPGIEAHTHEFIQTGKIDSKFGIQLNELDHFVQTVKKMQLVDLQGLHAHIGSQILDTKGFVAEAELVGNLTTKYGLPEINIGGGIGIAYLPAQTPPSIGTFAKEIAKALKGKTSAKLIVEPGRSIVGTAGITLYTIGSVKNIPGVRKYLIVNGGMSDNPRFILYQAKYDALLGNRPDEPKDDLVTVAGRFCESGDVILKDAKLPKAAAGDILTVLCTGAYNYSMASNYNRVGRPAMVVVNAGDAELAVRRENYEDLTRNDTI